MSKPKKKDIEKLKDLQKQITYAQSTGDIKKLNEIIQSLPELNKLMQSYKENIDDESQIGRIHVEIYTPFLDIFQKVEKIQKDKTDFKTTVKQQPKKIFRNIYHKILLFYFQHSFGVKSFLIGFFVVFVLLPILLIFINPDIVRSIVEWGIYLSTKLIFVFSIINILAVIFLQRDLFTDTGLLPIFCIFATMLVGGIILKKFDFNFALFKKFFMNLTLLILPMILRNIL